MDVEKTMEFILSQQAGFATRQADSERQIEALSRSVQALLEVVRSDHGRLDNLVELARLQGERLDAHDRRLKVQEERLEVQERRSEAFQQRFDQFLERFDAFLRGQGGNGR